MRPFSLMAGVAAVAVAGDTRLKWPNDVMIGGAKVGGILVERSDEVTVIGLGLNLWWRDPPDRVASLFDEDPGPEAHAGIGALWGAELSALIAADDWPRDRYREVCATLDRDITWEPEGRGHAVDIAPDGGLVVVVDGDRRVINSGAVHHVRG